MKSNLNLVEVRPIKAEGARKAADVAGLKFGKAVIVEFGKT